MSIDFSALVLAPNLAIFGKSVTVTPKSSQPFAAPYAATGIWTMEHVDVSLEDGSVVSSSRLKFGIRLADFTAVPKQGDWITAAVTDLPLGYWQGDLDPTSAIDLEVADFHPDGQGGATLILKRKTNV